MQQTLNILLVDDHPIVRAGLRAVLSGFDDIRVVAEAADGAEALSTAHSLSAAGTAIDIIVMDIQMKPLNGIDATAAFAAAGGPPVLILTTFDTSADIVAALEAGALGYLLKDAPPEQVHAAIRNTAAGKNTLSPDIASALMTRMQRSHVTLSAREKELLALLATGATNKELARQLFISEATVKTHLVHIYSKLGVDNRTGAIARAREEGLL
ncbi:MULTISPECIES: response regulator transcription factor [unclassified Rothia (in: high G+C Gram-positive bacteria)]|uniref:response regulator n=1 Tax=unclassified Rothia (in: high G+C Gram-positive bacteria) TaxID=2689056 RepID=UPI00195ABA93|nr:MULTISPECIES: response regulator transcription factor [unclassified Rothia (in: high G+C Gram-positive bacteria)]MBM7051557.1 response regulator transcription factor [Rothia sp. ZJ1223]QRZ61851.1 response regulator transcription factor [Rothia sp. ZJ932]